MGSKNRINLGSILEFILHFHRNFYTKTKIYMSKPVNIADPLYAFPGML